MQNDESTITSQARRSPWNKAKPPLRAKQHLVNWEQAQVEGEYATWSCSTWPSIASGGDVVSQKVEDVAPHGHASIVRRSVRRRRGDRSGSN
jgi:hypothetical protein